MALTNERFLEMFPEFSTVDTAELTTVLALNATETCEFTGFSTAALSELAEALHAAHTLKKRELAKDPIAGLPGIRRIQDRNDTLEFFGARYDLSGTDYGARLTDLMKRNYLGGNVS